jgi:flagellar biosynthetic protein FliQ
MSIDLSLHLMRAMLWTVVLVASPVLLAALAVGLIVNVLQVATQIQDITLSHIPKLLAAAIALAISAAWMMRLMVGFSLKALYLIARLG